MAALEKDYEEVGMDSGDVEGGRKTEVDDQFFKMSDMERFLDIEDRKEMDKGKKEESEEEDAIDMFDEIPDDEDKIMYKQYFDRHEINEGDQDGEYDEGEDGEEEDGEDEPEGNTMSTKKSSNKLLPSSDEEDEGPAKSNHEVAQERLAKKIGRLEEVAVGVKPWQMGGEVAAPVRPENSLLAEHP